MGLLNKIDRAEVGVPRAGRAAYQRLPPERCHPGRMGLPVGSTLQGRGLMQQLALYIGHRSAPGYAGEILKNRPDRCVTLHFCRVTGYSSSDTEFETACMKNFPLVRN